MKSHRIMKVLVTFFNVIIKHNHFLNRWLDVLDVMIEKGKGNKINKLRVIQTLEEDSQLMMRIFLRKLIEGRYESDKRLYKHEYWSRKGYSIESASLEKRFIFDLAKSTEEVFSYTISNLESCYDRQLTKIGGFVEE